MQLRLKRTLFALAVLGVTLSVSAFSLLGPYDAWQTPEIGYNTYGTDIGGPMNLGQEYRWNVKTITYGFTPEFWNYFGAHGTAAVMQAMAVLNNLKPFSQMSGNLNEYPLDTRRINPQASALFLLDVKTVALSEMLEEIGLASPDRYVWALRARLTPPGATNYTVIMRNFDPITLAPSMYVNGTLYTYDVLENLVAGATAADAIENNDIDPLAPTETAVVSIADDATIRSAVYSGEFVTGLTRDDVGGLRYLYDGAWFGNQYANVNTETLIPGTIGGGSPWSPVGGGTNNIPADQALRPGVDHIHFELFPSTYGFYDQGITFAVRDTDSFSTNTFWGLQDQSIERDITIPDIIFDAGDLGVDAAGNPILSSRSDTSTWLNNGAINGPQTPGPGEVLPSVVITFSTIGPSFFNSVPFFRGPPGLVDSYAVWASYDGTTNAPIIYPAPGTGNPGISVQERLQQLQNYGF